MNKRILAVCLCFVIAAAIFAGCKKKEASAVSVIVTDENGVAVTDENGEVVTEIATPVTDKDGKYVTEKATNQKGEIITDTDGNPKTVVVTEGGSQQQKSENNNDVTGEVPYSTTAPENNKTLDEWTFGNLSKVGCLAPNGWTNETVNQVVKNGTDTRVIMCPVNYLKSAGYTSADDYLKFMDQGEKDADEKTERIDYAKEVYEDGVGIAALYKAPKATTDANGYLYGKYHMTYIFQTGDRVRVIFVNAETEEEARMDISDVIANTYYRG